MQPASTNGNGRTDGKSLSQISTGLVQLYARYGGKRPTRAKTLIAGDTVVCVLRDAFTKLERTLLEGGETETVERIRDGFHRAMEADSRRLIEASCGRRVIACSAAMHVDPDMAVEIFQLEPYARDSWLFDVSGAGA